MCTQECSASHHGALSVGYSRAAWGQGLGGAAGSDFAEGFSHLSLRHGLTWLTALFPAPLTFDVLYSANNSGEVNKKIIFVEKKWSLNKR